MKNKKAIKTIPAFSSDAEESKFWDQADSTEYFSGTGGVSLKMPKRTTVISLRLPDRLLARLKNLAKLKDVAYQSLLKIYLDEKVREEMAGMMPKRR